MATSLSPGTTKSSAIGNFSNLPPEVLLEVIPNIPYTCANFASLHLTSPALHTLLQTHERSLVAAIKTTQIPRIRQAYFPDLPSRNYRQLRHLWQRLENLEEVHKQWLQIVCNHCAEQQWLKGRWDRIHKIGLLLLYRLVDVRGEGLCTYCAKHHLLQALPAASLACLLFKLVASVKILRVFGPEPVHARFCARDTGVRSDVELVVEECLLTHGPEFFLGLLEAGKEEKKEEQNEKSESNGDWAVRTLQIELSHLLPRQLNPSQYPPTLLSTLRRALARKLGCDVNQAVTKMWEILSGKEFAELDEEALVGSVGGGVV